MTTLLRIDASAQLEDRSLTRRLTGLFTRTFLAAAPDTRVIRRDVGRTPVPAIDHRFIHAAFTPPEARGNSAHTIFATGGNDCVVRLWSFAGAKVIAMGAGHSAPVRSLQFSPDGKQLVSVGEDAAVLVWNIFLDPPGDAPAMAPAEAYAP